jgi:hypothetical protein
MSNKNLILGGLVLALFLTDAVFAQMPSEPVAANLCDVFASPAIYDRRLLSVEGVLFPSFHSLFLVNASCMPKQGSEVSTEAILPPSWETLPNGKRLAKLLRDGKKARVKLAGTFESGDHRYGPDGARFRFLVTEIVSVEKMPDSRRSAQP